MGGTPRQAADLAERAEVETLPETRSDRGALRPAAGKDFPLRLAYVPPGLHRAAAHCKGQARLEAARAAPPATAYAPRIRPRSAVCLGGVMTVARRVLPQRLHFVSRRCTQRQLLLTPSRDVNRIVRYALATVASRYRVRVCAVAVLSNHMHALLEDPLGELPDFMHDLDQLIARALNAHYGRGENFWSQPDSYNALDLLTPEEVLEKLVYLYVNATKDGLVDHPDRWPGFLTRPEDMGARRYVEPRPAAAFVGGRRPAGFEPTYRPRGRGRRARRRRGPQPSRARHRIRPSTLPDVAGFGVAVPSLFADLPLPAFHRLVRGAVETRVAEIHAERAAEGLTAFMGPDRVRNQDPFRSAGDVFPDFALNPHLPGGDRPDPERVAELRAWRAAYRDAYTRWRSGRHKTVFPRGTYGVRRYHGALVAPS